MRHDLNPLDRAVFLVERETLHLKPHPLATPGGDRKSAEFKGKNQTETISVRSFAKDTVAQGAAAGKAPLMVKRRDPHTRDLFDWRPPVLAPTAPEEKVRSASLVRPMFAGNAAVAARPAVEADDDVDEFSGAFAKGVLRLVADNTEG